MQLLSHPTWHSRTSSWTLFVKIPQSILLACQTRTSDSRHTKHVTKSQFHTKVVVTDDCINVDGEGAPNVVGLFKGNSQEICSMNRYDCDLADLPVIILQQVILIFLNVISVVLMKLTDYVPHELVACGNLDSCGTNMVVDFGNRLQAKLFAGSTKKL